MTLETKYIQYRDHSSTAMSSTAVAAAAMVLSFHNIPYSIEKLNQQFTKTILSPEFNREYLDTRNDYPDKIDRATLCVRRVLVDNYKEISTRLYCTSIDKMYGSFIKRNIPIIINGKFPLLNGKVQNHIVMLGSSNGDFVVHDPLGNAMTAYRDTNGEYIKYPEMFLDQYLNTPKPIILITEKL